MSRTFYFLLAMALMAFQFGVGYPVRGMVLYGFIAVWAEITYYKSD